MLYPDTIWALLVFKLVNDTLTLDPTCKNGRMTTLPVVSSVRGNLDAKSEVTYAAPSTPLGAVFAVKYAAWAHRIDAYPSLPRKLAKSVKHLPPSP